MSETMLFVLGFTITLAIVCFADVAMESVYARK